MELDVAKVPQVLCYQCGTQIEVGTYQPFEVVVCPKCQMELSVPGRLGNMLLLNPIGRGSMGMVYRARDLTLMRIVAVKILKDREQGDQKRIAACLHEARSLAALSHPNVANVFSVGHERNQPFIVMEFVDGQRLDQMIRAAGRLKPKLALKLAMDVARGLRAAHKVGLIHGDVKPANILVTRKAVAKLVDFGIARPLEGGAKDKIFGTPYYVAPELVRREEFDHRCDVFSLGATLFESLTGRVPFKGKNAKHTIHMRLSKPAPNIKQLVPSLSSETAGLVARMLQNEPERRHQTYDDLIKALHEGWTESRRQDKGEAKGKSSKSRKLKKSGAKQDAAPKKQQTKKTESKADEAPKADSTPVADKPQGGIKAFNSDQVMVAFRRSCRGVRLMSRQDLIRSAAAHLGLEELDQENWDALNKQITVAARRKIISAEGDEIRLVTATFKEYESDVLTKAVTSVMRKGYEYERDAVTKAVAARFGFSNATKAMRERMKKIYNSAIRQNIIAYKGKWVWRAD